MTFIAPDQPRLTTIPPDGQRWLHEVKFDGWRLQLHKTGSDVTLYSRNGNDLTARFPRIAAAMRGLPARRLVLDGELVACDAHGLPDFHALIRRDANTCVWLFDLLQLDDRDLRSLPLEERKRRLQRLLARANDMRLRFSDHFDDAVRLLASAEELGLEGIVSKRRDAAYRSGRCDWLKIKCPTWRARHRERCRLFERSPKPAARQQ